jgi:hypothetical protein
MSTFAEDESSIWHNRPVELFDIVLPTVTYRIAGGNRDVQWGSLIYKATPIKRETLDASQVMRRRELAVSLPVDHPIVQRWFQQGVPPRQVTLTCYRKQERSGVIQRMWSGLVTMIECDGSIAKLTVPARTTDSIQRMLPTITNGSNGCVHVLYDGMCRVDRASFKRETTAILVQGRDIRVDIGAGHLGDWAVGGEFVHVASGERMTIAAQADEDPAHTNVTTLTLQLPIPGLKTGDAIECYAGCAHDIITCNEKFANQINFFGNPYKTSKNPFLPTGLGTVEQA